MCTECSVFALFSHTEMARSISISLNVSNSLECCLEMSMPISAIALMAKGLTVVGLVPALKTSYFSPYMFLSSPSAICDLAELWVQINRILSLVMSILLVVV